MFTLENLPKLAHEFFCEVADLSQLTNSSLFLCRSDGVPLYVKNELNSDFDDASVGALLGGVWQAARAMASFIPESSLGEEYRLSFDTSDKGIYIVPIDLSGEEVYLGLIYFNEVNPGMVKAKLRDLSWRLQEFWSLVNIKEDKSNANLFNNITDEEMDNLFAATIQ
ncbi:hypothetical protein BIY24_00285 [Halobacteriovorax marinus]|uniref:hypothetical protein n=1 Tax=Halobacteriovorax marinus TaxID=97084 RepID=UPI000313EE0E|nr:hypothetical protein [Halobacteriovorax marinus]ATH06430.1 hypothetical protein BIY24_00285 [Halobacteriovorax marinus]